MWGWVLGKEDVFVAKMRLTKGISLQGQGRVDGCQGLLSPALLITDLLSDLFLYSLVLGN